MTDSRIGVIVPVYNRGNLVVEALESIATQHRRPDRVVVVDDGSTDDTAARVERWISENGATVGAELVRQANAGVAAARNTAADRLVDCDLLASLDSDDLWPADYLQRMAGALTSAPAAVAAFTNRIVRDVHTGIEELKDHSAAQEAPGYHFIQGNMPTPSLTVVRRRAFVAAGGYNPGLRRREDTDLHLRLCLLGGWVFVPGEPVVMRRGVGVDTGVHRNLTVGYNLVDERLLRMRVIDRFVFHHGGRRVLDQEAAPWRRALSRGWRQVGNMLLQAGQRAQASWCFRQAMRVRPGDLKAWYDWLVRCRGLRPIVPAVAENVEAF